MSHNDSMFGFLSSISDQIKKKLAVDSATGAAPHEGSGLNRHSAPSNQKKSGSNQDKNQQKRTVDLLIGDEDYSDLAENFSRKRSRFDTDVPDREYNYEEGPITKNIRNNDINRNGPEARNSTASFSASSQSNTGTKAGGVNRAARLLLALGPERSKEVLKEMKDKEIERLALEMASVGEISPEEKKEILASLSETPMRIEMPVSGGIEQTREILSAAIGENRAADILSRIHQTDIKEDLKFLERIDPHNLASVLQQEHPQIAAVALSSIDPRTAAGVMKNLNDEFRIDIALRIAKTTKTHPESIERVVRILREKFEKRQDEFYSETGGAETLAGILNHMDRGMEDSILDKLATVSDDLLDDVRNMLYTFEELVNLDHREMRLLLSQVNDDHLLACALRGATDDIRRSFFNALSQNRAADIIDEIDRRGPISIREINEARNYIVSVARRLDEDDSILIKKSKEEYI